MKKFFALLVPVIVVSILLGYFLSQHLGLVIDPTGKSRDGTEKLPPIVYFSTAETKYFNNLMASKGSGHYLAGQEAHRRKDWESAGDYIDRLMARDSDNLDLKRQAMIIAMEGGRSNRAISLADALLEKQEGEDRDLLAILFQSLDQFEKEDYLKAQEILSTIGPNNPVAFIVPVLDLWAETAQGVFVTENMTNNPFYLNHFLLAGQYLNRTQQALDIAKEDIDNVHRDVRDLEKTGDIFYLLGDEDIAVSLYQRFLDSGYQHSGISEKLKETEEKKSIESLLSVESISSPKEGVALVFYDMAQILYREGNDESSTIFAQMALHLDPHLVPARMMIASILSQYEQYGEAIKTLEKIDTEHDLYLDAQRKIADIYSLEERNDEAIAILKNLYEANDDIDSLIQIGDIYRYEDSYEKAAKNYSQAIKEWEESEDKIWYVFYTRGMMYERMKKFEKAEKDLKKALEFRPNHPYILNYLGYSWVDRNMNIEEALELLKKAVKMRPDDGYITDSLGWAYYKMEDFETAIKYLEKATQLLPYDATVNDHLGDAYWNVGRKTEAKFQWQRAYNYSEEGDEELKLAIEEKLKNGLSAITVASQDEIEKKDKTKNPDASEEPAL